MEEEVKSTEVAEEPKVETPAEEVAQDAPKEETPKVEEAEPIIESPLIIPPPRKKTAQERIDEITRARREAERERDYYKTLALQKEQPPAAARPSAGTQRPTISQFDTTEAYEDALLQWHDERRTEQSRAEEIRKRTEDATYRFQERAKPIREQYEDFDDVVESPVFTPAMRSALLGSENGPELAYFLGRPENKATAEKINKLPVEMQLYELGKLEASLLVAKRTRKVPSAPPPPTPVSGMGGGSDEPPSDIAEWIKWDKQREIEKYKKKYSPGG